MQNSAINTQLKCIKFEIFGAVQGVGFRPFVYCICDDLKILGEVYNDSEGVKAILESTQENLDKFEKDLIEKLPPLARIDKINKIEMPIQGFKEFKIIQSQHTTKFSPILPDFAICNDCVREFYDKNNHRYHYPFINCTNCGPRLSIVKELPYDRINTTMQEFKMCDFCQSEYTDVKNRRYHAQPISCKDCGPEIFLKDNQDNILETNLQAIKELCEHIKNGKIVAIKSMGGFHIVCDATNSKAVENLRIRKKRAFKPFAIMCKNLEMAKKIANINEFEEKELDNNIKPIVILEKSQNPKIEISDSVAPNINKIGIFLPNTGLHLLLFEFLDFPIIATSANISSEPIIFNEKDLINKLSNVIDFYLDNNRTIQTPSDDSLCALIEQNAMYLRISRGINPQIFISNFKTKGIFLAIGAEMKNQFVIYKDSQIFISPYIGDLKNIATFNRFLSLLDFFVKSYDLKFDAIITDLHPDFLHTKYFKKQNYKTVSFQHHYTHLISVLYENNLLKQNKKFLGFCFDGTGYGDDGKIWGGEIFKFDEFEYKRIMHFDEFDLLSGENSIKNIYKLAISIIFKYNLENEAKDFLDKYNESEIKNLYNVFKSQKSVKTSSLGRIFDAFACIICGLNEVSFDGEAGMRLENLYIKKCEKFYVFNISNNKIEFKDVFLQALKDEPNMAATKFINGIAMLIIELAKKENLEIVLSGGVFQNSTLMEFLLKKCEEFCVKYYINSKYPTNDSSIALGQMVAFLSKYGEE